MGGSFHGPQAPDHANTHPTSLAAGLGRAVSQGEVLADDGRSYTTIAEAESKASDFILIGTGSFDEHVEITTAGLDVYGCGRATQVTHGSDHTFLVNANDVVLKNLAVKNTAGAPFVAIDVDNVDDVEVNTVWIESSSDEGIRFDRTGNGIARSMLIEDCGDTAFKCLNATDTYVENLNIRNTNSEGITFEGSGGHTLVGGRISAASGSDAVGIYVDDVSVHGVTVDQANVGLRSESTNTQVTSCDFRAASTATDLSAATDPTLAGCLPVGENTPTSGRSRAVWKGQAFADDGNLYSTVQGAVDAATDYVFVGPGTFSENVTIDTAGLHVVGSGRSTLVNGGSGFAIDVGTTTNDHFIHNLAVQRDSGSDAALRLNGVDDSTISRIWVESSSSVGTRIRNCSRARVHEYYAESCDSTGLEFEGSSETYAEHVVIRNTNSWGTSSYNSSGTTVNGAWISVTDRAISSQQDDDRYYNIVVDNAGDGVNLNGAGNRVVNCDLSGATTPLALSGATNTVVKATTPANTNSVTSNTTAQTVDTVLADASSAAVTVTLPAASEDVDVIVKATDATNNVDIATPNTETIDGSSSITLSTANAFRRITSDGSNYFVIASG